MARYFLGCLHAQYHPRSLLQQAVAGEQAGFDGIECSDHFQPWWEPDHSGQAWIWLGAAAEATERVPVGPAVTVAPKRYHPALVAQGFAALEAVSPGRIFGRPGLRRVAERIAVRLYGERVLPKLNG